MKGDIPPPEKQVENRSLIPRFLILRSKQVEKKQLL